MRKLSQAFHASAERGDAVAGAGLPLRELLAILRRRRNVIVWVDGLGRSVLDRRRWLYTAITRAEQGLVILA